MDQLYTKPVEYDAAYAAGGAVVAALNSLVRERPDLAIEIALIISRNIYLAGAAHGLQLPDVKLSVVPS